jgi:Cyclin, N-terminal domain/Cyclin, C-terminal domain
VNECKIPRDAVHVAMNLVDRYNALVATKHASKNHRREESHRKSTFDERSTATDDDPLHLVMVASLYLAIKLSCGKSLSSMSLAALSRGQMTALQVQAMEAKLLHGLDWLVHPPTSHDFLHAYARLLILEHEQEQQQQQCQHFDSRRRREPGTTVTDGTTACTASPTTGGSYITPVSGPIQFHYGMFSNGAGQRLPAYREVMASVSCMACQVLDTAVSHYAFVRFKPSSVACAALYYAMQYHEDEGYFYHIYRHHAFPSPLEQLHSQGVMVHGVESSKCLESIYLLFEAAPAAPAIAARGQQQSEKNRSSKKKGATTRTTSPQNIMDQLDATVNDP